MQDAADRIIDTYSVGMKQRLAIARAIISKPRLLIHEKIGKYRKVEISDINKGLDVLRNGLDIKNIKAINEHELYIYDLSVSGKEISKALIENGIL